MGATTALEAALRQVPFVATLGVHVESARPGRVVLRLPAATELQSHAGTLHTAAVFAVGELAASVAMGTHAELSRVTHFLRATRVAYAHASRGDVTAHADVRDEMVDAVRRQLQATGKAKLELPVKVLDAKGGDVAEVIALFQLRG